MPEREPQVTFTDRRKISSDGEIRPEALAEEEASRRQTEQREAAIKTTPPPPAMPDSSVNNEPTRDARSPERTETNAPAQQDEAIPEGPTAQESAESHEAYRQTTAQLDELLRGKTPDAAHMGPVSFEHLVQSMYMTAMMALGAGTQPGEKPRIDIMGARQTVDLLGVLGEKTKGNLSADEQRLLESALFELRMMFLEITNAIARNAANPAQPQPPKRK